MAAVEHRPQAAATAFAGDDTSTLVGSTHVASSYAASVSTELLDTQPLPGSSPMVIADVRPMDADNFWTPLTKIFRATASGAYYGSGAIQGDDAIVNLGDELYVFEAHSSGTWYRGYVVSTPKIHAVFNQPTPGAKVDNASLQPLELNARVCVFPKSIVKIREAIAIPGLGKNDASALSGLNKTSSIIAEYDDASSVGGVVGSEDSRKPKPPAIPHLRILPEDPSIAGEPLVDDITSVLKEWYSTYVYHNFLHGNYDVVDSIYGILNELFDLRIKLGYGLMTRDETIACRRRAIWAMGKVIKHLRRGIIVRDKNTGDIVGSEIGPIAMAQEQMLLAVSAQYPQAVDIHSWDRRNLGSSLPQHVLVDFDSIYGSKQGEGFTISLYLRSKLHRLTETFEVRPESSRGDLSAVLFKDVPLTETRDDTYLVAEVFETLPIRPTSANPVRQILGAQANEMQMRSEQPLTSYRRGVAAGVTAISRLFRHEAEGETTFSIRMYASYIAPGDSPNQNSGWGGLVDRLVNGNAEGVAITPRVRSMTCKVTNFEAKHIEEIPVFGAAETREAIELAKSLFSTTLAPQKDTVWLEIGQLDLNLPNNHNATELFTVSITVSRNSAAKISLPDSRTTNKHVTSSVMNRESFGESVVVVAPNIEDTLDVHLYYGGQLMATALLSAWGDEGITNLPLNTGRDGHVGMLKIQRKRVSSSHVLDDLIQRVLNWRDHFHESDTASIKHALKGFAQVSESNIKEYYHQVLDSLIEMIYHFSSVDGIETPGLQELFRAILYTIDKSAHTYVEKEMLFNDYMENNFVQYEICGVLIGLVEREIAMRLSGHLEGRPLTVLFSYFGMLANIITTAGKELKAQNAHAWKDVQSVLSSYVSNIGTWLKRLVSSTETPYTAEQRVLTSNVDKFFLEFRQIISGGEIVKCLLGIINAYRTDNQTISTLTLLIVKRLSKSWVFTEKHYRPYLAAHTIVTAIKTWNRMDDSKTLSNDEMAKLRLISAILASQFESLWALKDTEQELCSKYAQLMPIVARRYTKVLAQYTARKEEKRIEAENNRGAKGPLVYTHLFPEEFPPRQKVGFSGVRYYEFDETLIELGVILAMLVSFAESAPDGLALNLAKFSSEQLVDLSTNIINACLSMLNSEPFPKLWISLLAQHTDTVYHCLLYVSRILKARFLPQDGHDFRPALWSSFMACVLRLAGHESLSMEHLSEQKRTAVWRIAHDLRGRAVQLLREMWDQLGVPAREETRIRFGAQLESAHQLQVVLHNRAILQHIINIGLVRYPPTQESAVYLLHSIIVEHAIQNTIELEDWARLRRDILKALDDVFSRRAFRPDHYEQQTFVTALRQSFSKMDPEDIAAAPIAAIVDGIDEFIDLLIDLHGVPEGSAYNDERIFHELNIRNFLKDINKDEDFVSYLGEVAEANAKQCSHVQVGLAYRLLAEAYDWSYDVNLPELQKPRFPRETSFERKERLYEKMIEAFRSGNAFEPAIEACRELVVQHETVSLDYEKLSRANSMLSELFLQVETSERLMPKYYHVHYIGVGFPRSLRDRQFIFEEENWVNLNALCDRSQRLHAGAKVVSHLSHAEEGGQYIVVNSVQPEFPSREVMHTKWIAASPGTKQHIIRRNLCRFSAVRPLPCTKADVDSPGEEALYIPVEKSVYETLQDFPCIVKRSEVNVSTVRKHVVSPLENAIVSMIDKISSLNDLEYKNTTKPAGRVDVSSLTREVQSAVDSPVNGGVNVYRKFFSLPEYAKDPLLVELECAFVDAAAAVHRCLNLMDRHIGPKDPLKPFSDSLRQLFSKNYSHEIARLKQEGRLSSSASLADRRLHQTSLSRVARYGTASVSAYSRGFSFQSSVGYSLNGTVSTARQSIIGSTRSK